MTLADWIRAQMVQQTVLGMVPELPRRLAAADRLNAAEEARAIVEAVKARGLIGVEFVVTDDHGGLKKAVSELLTRAAWQRCYVHSLRNALDHLPRRADDDSLQELRWIYDRRKLQEAQVDLAAWLKRWQQRYAKLTDWAEEAIGQTLTFYGT